MKIYIFFSLAAVLTTNANRDLFSNNTLRQPDDINSVADGIFEGVTNMLFFDDVMTCYKYNMVLIWNFVDAIKYIFIDPWLAVETVGIIIHKSPVVYGECMRILSDLEHLEEDFSLLDDISSTALWVHLFENLMFNLGDIIKNVQLAPKNLEIGEYYEYGLHIGEIIADVIFLNPSDEHVWTVDNSIIVRKDSADKIPSTFYESGSPNVRSINPSE